MPATIILIGIAFDLIVSLPFPFSVKKAWKWLTRPFRQFMTLDDLLEPIGPFVKISNATYRILSTLATLSIIGWLGCFAFGIYTNDVAYAIRAVIFVVCWVSFFAPSLHLLILAIQVLSRREAGFIAHTIYYSIFRHCFQRIFLHLFDIRFWKKHIQQEGMEDRSR